MGKILKGLDEEGKKEGTSKRLKNIEKNENNNNNNHNSNLSSERSVLSSARSELSTNTLIGDDDDDEVQTSFEYLKDNKKEF